MNTLIIDRDLTKQAPHSPRKRIAGFAIACRAVDKCRASLAGTLGEYHYDCPLDNQLFSFKGITGEQFKTAVPENRTYFVEACQKLGLKPDKTTTFDWLEADDHASFSRKSV